MPGEAARYEAIPGACDAGAAAFAMRDQHRLAVARFAMGLLGLGRHCTPALSGFVRKSRGALAEEQIDPMLCI